MMAGGVYTIDGAHFKETGFIPTGVGAHGLYPSRDGTKLYVANRGQNHVQRTPARRSGSVSVIDFATRKVVVDLADPGRRQPRHGQRQRRRQVAVAVAVASTTSCTRSTRRTGAVDQIPVGKEPHGLTVWPQPGRYSLGHTGNMR